MQSIMDAVMTFLNDLTLQQIVTRGIAYLLFAFAYLLILKGVSRLGGDNQNPTGNVSAWGLVMAILFRTGWVLVPSYAAGGKNGRIWQALAPFAASACLLAAIPLIDLIKPSIYGFLNPTMGQFGILLFNQLQEVAVGSALLCLLPWPGLPGALILLAVKPDLVRRLQKWEWPAALVLIGFMLAVFDPSWVQALLSGLSLTR